LRAIIKIAGWGMRHKSYFKFRIAVWNAEFGETTSEGQHSGFDSADARGKEVRINEQLHS